MELENVMVTSHSDPMQPATRKIFLDNFGRSFYLLWRRDHMVSNEFITLCELIMDRFDVLKPTTLEALVGIIPIDDVNFSTKDVKDFCAKYESYLIGDSRVGYIYVNKSGKVEND